MEVRTRETLILVNDFDMLLEWYCNVLDFKVRRNFFEEYHYCVLENSTGIQIAIGLASDMGIELRDRAVNSIVMQFEVDDVKKFLDFISENGGSITGPAMYSEKDGFWFGSFADPDGNSHWVVDKNCP